MGGDNSLLTVKNPDKRRGIFRRGVPRPGVKGKKCGLMRV